MKGNLRARPIGRISGAVGRKRPAGRTLKQAPSHAGKTGKVASPCAQLAFHESEANYRALFEQATDAIVVFDPETLVIVDFNQAACRHLGYTHREFSKLRISDFEAIESPEETRRHSKRIPTTGIAVFETKHRAKSGAVLNVEVRARTITLGGRRLVQGLWRDISSQKAILEQLRRSELLLEQTQRISLVGGWEQDLITGKSTWTDETYKIHGVSKRTFDPSNVRRDISFYVGDDQKRLTEAFQALVKYGRPYDLELRFRSAKGRHLWVRTIGQAELSNGKIVRVFGIIMDITAGKQAELALKASENRYRLFAEHASDVVWTMNLAGELTYVSPATILLSGYTAEQLMRKPLGHHIAPGSLKIATETLGELIAKGRKGVTGLRLSREIEQLRKDGSTVWTDTVCHLVRDSISGDIIILGVSRDISERKSAEEALRASEEFHRLFTDNASDTVWTMNLDGQFTYVSPTTFKLRGYTAEEVVRQPLEQQIAPGSLQTAAEAIGALIANGRKGMVGWRTTREIEQTCKDGSTVWTDVVCDLVKDATTGSIIILGVTRNISERRRAEDALRKMTAELERRVEERTADLRKSFERLETIMEAAHMVGWDLDPATGKISETGPVAELFGRPSGFQHQDLARFIESVHPEDRQMMRTTIETAFKGKDSHHYVEFRVLPRDEQFRWLAINGSVERDASGKPVRARGITRDITDRKSAEELLSRTNQALRVLTECGHALLRTSSEQDLLTTACKIAVEVGSYSMAWVGYAGQEPARPIHSKAVAGAMKDLLSREEPTWANTASGQGPTGTAIRTGKPNICRDASTDPLFNGSPAADLKKHYAAALALPLPSEQGCLGALTVYSADAKAFQDAEIKLLQQLASDLAFGIMALRGRVERAELQRQVLDISEREQRRIGQDLHDGVGQSLAGISYLISAVQLTLPEQTGPEAEELERIAQLVGKTVQQASDLAHGLFPAKLGKTGFTDALRELAMHTQSIFGITCTCSGPLSVNIGDDAVAYQVYRIVQEAVHNAAKHSRSKTISISVSEGRSRLAVIVTDNGVGIPPTAASGSGMGQRIMRYRAGMIGASLTITSTRGKGTQVTCVIPRTAGPRKEITT